MMLCPTQFGLQCVGVLLEQLAARCSGLRPLLTQFGVGPNLIQRHTGFFQTRYERDPVKIGGIEYALPTRIPGNCWQYADLFIIA